jgi:hypothetical protein
MMDLKKRWPPSTHIDKIPQITRDREELCANTIRFIDRIDKEFQHYFPQPDMDMRLALYFHPGTMFPVLE